MLEGYAALRTSRKTRHAADTIRVANKIRISHINVHRTRLAAKLAVNTSRRVAANTDNAYHAPQASSGATSANIVAERAVEEHPEKHKDDKHHKSSNAKLLPSHELTEVLGALQHAECNAHGQQEVEHVSGQLQVTLDSIGNAQHWQTQHTSELVSPILKRTQGANPPAE